MDVAKRNACIVVLGDIGRSPRMEYHAISLLQENYHVDMIGYVESKPIKELTNPLSSCKIHELKPVPNFNLSPKIKLFIKSIWQALNLLTILAFVKSPNFLLVQNPPGIPALIVCYIYCVLRRIKLVIDWHNYTYTILALGMPNGEKNLTCRVAKWIEKFFGRKADYNFCVTKAMKKDLVDNWNIRKVNVLYDRPPAQFRSVSLSSKHELFMKLCKIYPQFLPKCYGDLKESGVLESTALTQKLSNGTVLYKPNRMAVLVSSTSWTPDEDFSLLLKALQIYEEKALNDPTLFPNLLCIITGKGPQKEEYERKIEALNFTKVSIITPWLDIEDYPTVLAAADLGVCLHWSSSGLDLPMKIVDMFGCGLPVCAYKFQCIEELVKPGENGFIFTNHIELAEQILLWFENFPNNPTLVETKKRFRRNLDSFQNLRWTENWANKALPIFNSFV